MWCVHYLCIVIKKTRRAGNTINTAEIDMKYTFVYFDAEGNELFSKEFTCHSIKEARDLALTLLGEDMCGASYIEITAEDDSVIREKVYYMFEESVKYTFVFFDEEGSELASREFKFRSFSEAKELAVKTLDEDKEGWNTRYIEITSEDGSVIGEKVYYMQ